MMKKIVIFPIIFSSLIMFASLTAFAERERILPSSSFELTNSRTADFGGRKWFTRIETGAHPAFRGTAGGGLAVGRMFGDMFIDFSATYHKTVFRDLSYHYINDYNYDYDRSENFSIDRGAEYSKKREAGANGNLTMLAPGIGYFFKFWGLDEVYEIFRFKAGYARYNHTQTDQSFNGYVFGFSGAVGIDLGVIVLSPGVSFDMMKLSRSDGGRDKDYAAKNHLPLMMWNLNLNAYVFTF